MQKNKKLFFRIHELEISQSKLARSTGISESRLSRIVRGWIIPTTKEIIKLSEALAIPPNQLGLEQQNE